MLDPIARNVLRLLEGRQKRAIETDDAAYAVGSTIGAVRSSNEDVAIVVRCRGDMVLERYDLAVVCDGMGGMKGGRRAAMLATATFVAHVMRHSRRHPHDRLTAAAREAHRAVFSELKGDGGTTLTAILTGTGTDAWIAHVGDTRAYGLRDREIIPLTVDHTLGAALQVGADQRPDANRLLQFVGMDEDLHPDVHLIEAADFQTFLLTSDGAHGAQPELLRRVASHARSGPDLVRRLLNLSDLLGGLDNTTALVLPTRVTDDPNPDGAGITILSPAGLQEIWLFGDLGVSGRSEFAANAPLPRGEPKQVQGKAREEPAPRRASPKTKKSGRKTKAKATTVGLLDEDPDLQVTLDFSDDQEAKDEAS